ncbi:MAG: hypothetical protein ACLUSV_02585 [Streptococcus sp.]
MLVFIMLQCHILLIRIKRNIIVAFVGSDENPNRLLKFGPLDNEAAWGNRLILNNTFWRNPQESRKIR